MNYITNPVHGGKVTCHRCGDFISKEEGMFYFNSGENGFEPFVWFHRNCFNRYEHYYGLDRPID